MRRQLTPCLLGLTLLVYGCAGDGGIPGWPGHGNGVLLGQAEVRNQVPGQVARTTGSKKAGLVLDWVSASGRRLRVETDQEGFFVAPDLAPDLYSLVGVTLIEQAQVGGRQFVERLPLRLPHVHAVLVTPGTIAYAGTLVVEVGASLQGRFGVMMDPEAGRRYLVAHRRDAVWARWDLRVAGTPPGWAPTALLAEIGSQVDSPGHVAVPVQWAGRSLVVQASLNDRREARLVVDSGASLTVLSQEVARELNLLPAQQARTVTLRTAGGPVQAQIVQVPVIRVGEATVRNVQVAIHDLPDKFPGVDGLLGLSFLDQFQMTLDMAKGVLHLTRRE